MLTIIREKEHRTKAVEAYSEWKRRQLALASTRSKRVRFALGDGGDAVDHEGDEAASGRARSTAACWEATISRKSREPAKTRIEISAIVAEVRREMIWAPARIAPSIDHLLLLGPARRPGSEHADRADAEHEDQADVKFTTCRSGAHGMNARATKVAAKQRQRREVGR